MTRVLTVFNLIGVCGLAVLCGFQWQANGRATGAAEAAEVARAESAARATEQARSATTAAADLDDVRGRLTGAQASLADATGKLAAASAERDRLLSDRGEYRAAVDRWSAAVAQRDAALKRVAAERDDAVGRYNGLVAKGNAAAVK